MNIKVVLISFGLLTGMLLAAGGQPHAVPLAKSTAAPMTLAPVAPAKDCRDLSQANQETPDGSSATISEASVRQTPAGDFCVVRGTINPAIKFEVDLPVKGWTQRYLQTGCGGLCGELTLRVDHAGTCGPAVGAELVVASDDMGHQNQGMNDGTFGTDPQKRIDFAYRANHETAIVAKALIRAYYGRGPRFSYFLGCSDGGREGLIEAQRFPDDFDGIAAGAPAMNFQVQNSFYHAWMARSNADANGRPILLASRLPILHQAVLAACDGLDGVKDGLISDPRVCHFDPRSIVCKAGVDDSHCLTSAEVEVAERFYAGPVDADGTHFTIGGPQYGSELAWVGVYVPDGPNGRTMSGAISSSSLHYVIFPEPSATDGDIPHFAFTKENFRRLDMLHPLYDAMNTNLSQFEKRRGRLILWHGWSDPHISPLNTIAYYRGVEQKLGAAATDQFLRLFLFTGMYHCAGGDGFSQFDVLTPLMAWVEHGAAPERIVARQVAYEGSMGSPRSAPGLSSPLPQRDVAADATRPAFPYPLEAKYTGMGDVKDAVNWAASPQKYREPQNYNWLGAHLIASDNQRIYHAEGGKLLQEP